MQRSTVVQFDYVLPRMDEKSDQSFGRCKSGREDLNLRPPAPHAGALAELRYAPEADIIFDLPLLEKTRKNLRLLRLIRSQPVGVNLDSVTHWCPNGSRDRG